MNNIKMLNSDFRNVMDFIKDDFTIITDPPYNINYNYNSYNDNLPEKDYINLISSFKNKKLAIIHYPEETMKYFIPALGVPDVVNTWCYNSNLPNRQHRLINFYNLKPDYTKVLQPFKNPNDKRIKERIKKGVKGARSYDWFNDIQLVKNVTKQEHNHPCPVPVKLMERIIKLTTKENDLIFDPFAGSGTTAIACINTKRRFVGTEIDSIYYDMAIDRISKGGDFN